MAFEHWCEVDNMYQSVISTKYPDFFQKLGENIAKLLSDHQSIPMSKNYYFSKPSLFGKDYFKVVLRA